MSYDTDWPAIRARLKAAREARGWTQRDLGEAVGMTTTRISQIESVHAVSEPVLARLAEALGRSVRWLRYGEAEVVDADAIRQEGYAAGQRDTVAAIRAVLAQMGPETPTAAPGTGAAEPVTHGRGVPRKPFEAPTAGGASGRPGRATGDRAS